MKLIFSELGQVVLVPSHCLQVDIQLTFVPNRVRLNWQDLMTLRPICTNDDTCLTAIFQDNRDMPVSECILSLFLILLELRMMEVVVTTGAIRHARSQSNGQHQQVNTQLFNSFKALMWNELGLAVHYKSFHIETFKRWCMFFEMAAGRWYVSHINRQDAENMLLEKNTQGTGYIQRDGAFLVRPSESTPGEFSLSVK